MNGGLLGQVQHIVVLMLENRSFDHMLGWLYTDAGNVSPSGQPFDGLTGAESNPDTAGNPVRVFRITSATPNANFMPGADPGEGYNATNSQLFGSIKAPAAPPAISNQGFVTDFAYTLGWEGHEHGWTIESGTTPNDIMGCFDPSMLPILSGLAKGYAVCDQYFASAPTETLPNRAFMAAATSQGHLKDTGEQPYTAPTIFGAMTKASVSWKIYGYNKEALVRSDFPDLESAPDANFGLFTDFQNDAASGNLAAYSFVEPGWSGVGQNDQHPVSDIATGEQLIHDVYYALKNGPAWNQTLLVVNYDEHGGCYDHVPPPWTATPPDTTTVGELGFDFKRFGVRVPAVLVSPLIAGGTVFRAPAGAPAFDHTSVLKTIELRFGVPNLTDRDQAAADLGAVLTLTTPRIDDPLAGVAPPPTAPAAAQPAAQIPTHLQQVHAKLVANLPVEDAQGGAHHTMPALTTSADYDNYISQRTARWRSQRRVAPTSQ